MKISDHDAMQCQCSKLYGQANMLCTNDVKIALFKTYSTPLYTAQLWYSYSNTKIKKLQVAYNNVFQLFLKCPRWTSASEIFVTSKVPTFHAAILHLNL